MIRAENAEPDIRFRPERVDSAIMLSKLTMTFGGALVVVAGLFISSHGAATSQVGQTAPVAWHACQPTSTVWCTAP